MPIKRQEDIAKDVVRMVRETATEANVKGLLLASVVESQVHQSPFKARSREEAPADLSEKQLIQLGKILHVFAEGGLCVYRQLRWNSIEYGGLEASASEEERRAKEAGLW